LGLKRLPAAIKLGHIIDVGLNGTDGKRRQFRNQLGYGDTLLRCAPLQRRRGAIIDFNRLGFHD
jgi:hypothetical protein